MFLQTADESIIDTSGRVIYFSLARFIADIAQGNCCFVCGASPDKVPFNYEHVLPDWILRRYNLQSRAVILPNGSPFRYGGFKIPCCVACNSRMGEEIENPIRAMFDGGYNHFIKEIQRKGPWEVFCWMARIFLKTHLKDDNLRYHLDARKGEVKIGEMHSWEDLHHIHCVARAFYTGCKVRPEALGSMYIAPAKILPYGEQFDYSDLTFAQTMLLRIGEVAILVVLNDSLASITANGEMIDKITGPLSPLQLRELAVRMAAVNNRLVDRPRFFSDFDLLTEQCNIGCERPQSYEIENMEAELFGKMMHHVCGAAVLDVPEKPQILEDLKKGTFTFLLDSQGRFAADHMDVITPAEPWRARAQLAVEDKIWRIGAHRWTTRRVYRMSI
jgi:hypothetical protein